MAGRFIRGSHLRSLLPAVLLLAPALAVAAILVGAFTGAERPTGADGVAPAEAATRGDQSRGRGAKTITIGWVGDITPGSRYGLPANGGASLFAKSRTRCARPTSWRATSRARCRPAARRSAARARRTASPSRRRRRTRRALGAAGLDVVNLANNHAFDYGERPGADRRARSRRRGSPPPAAGRGARARPPRRAVAFVGFSTYRWSGVDGRPRPSAPSWPARRAPTSSWCSSTRGAEGADRTHTPGGREGRSARTAATRARSPTRDRRGRRPRARLRPARGPRRSSATAGG